MGVENTVTLTCDSPGCGKRATFPTLSVAQTAGWLVIAVGTLPATCPTCFIKAVENARIVDPPSRGVPDAPSWHQPE